jgi:FMN-dependent NADH-azoreductase
MLEFSQRRNRMSTLFRLDASIRHDGSVSRSAGDVAERAVLGSSPGTGVVRRDIGARPLSSSAWAASSAAAALPDDARTDEQRAAVHLATRLADELEDADGFLFAAPLYNWGVSQHFKTWFDIVVTDPRFSPRSSTIAGRPAVLVIARGGDYREGAARAEWDHASGWMRRVLGDLWGLDLAIVEVNLTLAPAREYMAHLRQDAAEEAERGTSAAEAAGRALGRSMGNRP